MSSSKKSPSATEPYGNLLTFCEPSWYQGFASPYYKESHIQFRNTIRSFVEAEIAPFIDDWIKNKKEYPRELHEKAYKAGIAGILFPKEYGGTKPSDFDSFHELILWDELYRYSGQALGQLSINSMALPPILKNGSEEMKKKMIDVIQGRKFCSLMISEPTHGSDVAGIRTTAVREGDFYIVSGSKKWITGGHMADYFTTAVRTGGEGGKGISLLLLEKGMPGIKIRKMETMFDTTHGTTFVDLDNVRVPASNRIGQEGTGMAQLMYNFNHERYTIAVQALRGSRTCYSLALQESLSRKTFGKTLISHQIIRFKLAEMARQIESLQAMTENVAYQFSSGVADRDLGGSCALLKVQGSKTFEYCAREAVQIFGGSGLVREGRGIMVERLYRDVREKAIPGGSEEILLDLAIREAVKSQL